MDGRQGGRDDVAPFGEVDANRRDQRQEIASLFRCARIVPND